MATLTVQGVEDALLDICGSKGANAAQFRKELNLALPRLWTLMGGAQTTPTPTQFTASTTTTGLLAGVTRRGITPCPLSGSWTTVTQRRSRSLWMGRLTN